MYSFQNAAYFFIISIFIVGCSNKRFDNIEYLETVSDNIAQIKSVTYTSTHELFLEYDTINPQYREKYSYKEFLNPADTLIGASFIRLLPGDSIKMSFCYDGNMRARVHWDEKSIEIDSFKTSKTSDRRIFAPFFTRANTIIKYILSSDDSIVIHRQMNPETILFAFIIYDNFVDFIGNRAIKEADLSSGKSTKHSLWISKSTNLPFRIKSEIPFEVGEIRVETIEDVSLHDEDESSFMASKYIPDYPLRSKKQKAGQISGLVGKIAPNWKLINTDEDTISLESISAKIVLLDFTGIGCGPCFASIPFLKQLNHEYEKNELQILSIETWNSDLNTIKKHKENYALNYMYLLSNKAIKDSYFVESVPAFLLIDENKRVVKVFEGYAEESTDKQIRDAINDMI